MAQLNLRLEEVLVRRFASTAAALGKTCRAAAAEALAAWTKANAKAARAVVGTDLQGDEPTPEQP